MQGRVVDGQFSCDRFLKEINSIKWILLDIPIQLSQHLLFPCLLTCPILSGDS